MELELQAAQSQTRHKTLTDVAAWTLQLFSSTSSSSPLTPQAVARVLRDERFTEEQVVLLWQDLYRRRHEASGVPPSLIPTAIATTATPTDETKDSLNNNGQQQQAIIVNETEVELLTMYMETLLNATAILDEETNNLSIDTSSTSTSTATQPIQQQDRNRRWSGRVYSQLKTLQKDWDKAAQLNFQRRIAANVQAALKSNLTVTEYVRRSLGLRPVMTTAATSTTTDDATVTVVNTTTSTTTTEVVGTTGGGEPISLVPLWIPPSLLPFVLASQSRLNVVDVRAIKERVLPKTRFFCTSSASTASAAVFRGNMRAAVSATTTNAAATQADNDRTFPAAVFGEIQSELDRAGLAERIQLFLLPDPEWVPNAHNSHDRRPKPVLVALPKAVTPDDSVVRQSLSTRLVKKASLVLGVAAAFAYSVTRYALHPRVFDAVVHEQNLSPVVSLCVPMFLGVLAIQGIHEAAHRWVAKKRGMKIGLPLLIPSVQVGTFGCITPLRSFPPNRSALLDFALSGPMSAMMLSVLFMMVGCYKTVYASQAKLALYPVVSVALLKSSFLSGSMLTFLLPKAMMLPLSQPIPIHRESNMPTYSSFSHIFVCFCVQELTLLVALFSLVMFLLYSYSSVHGWFFRHAVGGAQSVAYFSIGRRPRVLGRHGIPHLRSNIGLDATEHAVHGSFGVGIGVDLERLCALFSTPTRTPRPRRSDGRERRALGGVDCVARSGCFGPAALSRRTGFSLKTTCTTTT